MLVLSRKAQETVVVGGCESFQRVMRVKVLEIVGQKVKLGFDVDPAIPVYRLEVWERICVAERIAGPPAVAARPAG